MQVDEYAGTRKHHIQLSGNQSMCTTPGKASCGRGRSTKREDALGVTASDVRNGSPWLEIVRSALLLEGSAIET
jgi:hypothetical protein